MDRYYKIHDIEHFVLSREFGIYVILFLIEYRACQLYVLIRSSGLVFVQVCVWNESSAVLRIVPLRPIVPGCTVE